jgi:hypothetical protein
MFLLAATPAWSQPSSIQDFAERIVSALAPGAAVRLVCSGDDGRTQRELARLLSDRGVRLSDATDGTIAVRCSCLENLKEHVCLADIGDGSARRVVITTRPREAADLALQAPIVALELRPLHAQRDPILDVTVAGASLLVLSPAAVTQISILPQTSIPPKSVPVTTSRIWPRDLRGRIRATSGGFDVFLPGVICRGSSTPFALACADEGDAWPIGIENAGIAPSRNIFATPEGLAFYDAAPLGDGQWLVVDRQRMLMFLDSNRRLLAKGDAADHVAALRSACAPDTYVVTTTRSPDAEGADVLRLSRVAGRVLVPEASALVLPGVLTALWPAQPLSVGSEEREAMVVVHDIRTGRYEAFHLSLSCTR